MPQSHADRRLFLHEKINLGRGTPWRYAEVFAEHYQPLMERLGARLFGLWATSELNGRWPEVTQIWEIDGYPHLAQIGSARHGDPTARKASAAWRGLLAEWGAKGEGRVVYGHAGIRSVDELRAAGICTAVVLEEILTTKPGAQATYVQELEYLYVPWSEDTGKHRVGSFTTVFRRDEVIHYWALEGGFEALGRYWPSWGPEPDPRIRAWMNLAPALREGWEDSFLVALPPNPLG